jgi:hypothetical protein
MPILKLKKVKRHEYFYWSKSVRSHKRFGGGGRVRTVDYLIGTHPISGNWLPYHLWTHDIDLQEYSKAVIRWNIGINKWQKLVDFTIDFQKNKVSLKGLVPPVRMMGIVFGVDCRSKRWRKIREDFQEALNQIVERNQWIEAIIEKAAYYIGLHDRYLAKAKEFSSGGDQAATAAGL